MDIEGAEATVLPQMRDWLHRHGRPPVQVSLHKWLWPKTGETPGLLAAVFGDYAHVYNSRLEEIPRSQISADLFGERSDSMYLLVDRQYDFPTLSLDDYQERQNGQGGVEEQAGVARPTVSYG